MTTIEKPTTCCTPNRPVTSQIIDAQVALDPADRELAGTLGVGTFAQRHIGLLGLGHECHQAAHDEGRQQHGHQHFD